MIARYILRKQSVRIDFSEFDEWINHIVHSRNVGNMFTLQSGSTLIEATKAADTVTYW